MSIVRDACSNRLCLSDGDVGSGRNRNGTMRGLFSRILPFAYLPMTEEMDIVLEKLRNELEKMDVMIKAFIPSFASKSSLRR